jgi:hypothetical protein
VGVEIKRGGHLFGVLVTAGIFLIALILQLAERGENVSGASKPLAQPRPRLSICTSLHQMVLTS